MLYNEVYKLINDIYLNNHESYTNEIIQFICTDLKIDPLDTQFFCNKYNSIFFYSLTDYINNLKYGNINNIYNTVNYIIVKKILIDNTTFLIDKNNNLYSYENPPKLIGKHTKSI